MPVGVSVFCPPSVICRPASTFSTAGFYLIIAYEDMSLSDYNLKLVLVGLTDRSGALNACSPEASQHSLHLAEPEGHAYYGNPSHE